MNDLAASRLADARYASLATFRRDGREVRTPIWLAGNDGRLYIFTGGDSGKVKRIRASGRARLAPCTASGVVTGEWVEMRGRVVTEPGEIADAYTVLRAKYGWQMLALDLVARVTGRYARRAILALESP